MSMHIWQPRVALLSVKLMMAALEETKTV